MSGRELEIIATSPFEEVAKRMRETRLWGIPELLPYWRSKISLETVFPEEIFPTALYVLTPQLQVIETLHGAFQNEAGVDIFSLSQEKTLIEYSLGGVVWKIIPPIVECLLGLGWVIDGLHRITVAHRMNYKTMNVILVEEPLLPPPSWPVPWAEVKEVRNVPPQEKKRRYTFSSVEGIKMYMYYIHEEILQAIPHGSKEWIRHGSFPQDHHRFLRRRGEFFVPSRVSSTASPKKGRE